MKKLLSFLTVITVFAVTITPRDQQVKSWTEKEIKPLGQSTVIVFGEQGDTGWVGTGVFLDKKGTILTAAHVVDEEEATYYAVLYDGREYECDVLATDNRRDLGLLRVQRSAQAFKYAKLAPTLKIYVGQDILLIGHPYELYFTVTKGIITRFWFDIYQFTWRADTDATVNPGNSGGPVFNDKGEIVGIVSAMYVTAFRQPLGIGIFIPIKEIRTFLKNNKDKINVPLPRPKYRLGDLM